MWFKKRLVSSVEGIITTKKILLHKLGGSGQIGFFSCDQCVVLYFLKKKERKKNLKGLVIISSYLQLLGQLCSDALQQRNSGFLCSQQDELHISVSTEQQAFGENAYPHHSLQHPRWALSAAQKDQNNRHEGLTLQKLLSISKCFLHFSMCRTLRWRLKNAATISTGVCGTKRRFDFHLINLPQKIKRGEELVKKKNLYALKMKICFQKSEQRAGYLPGYQKQLGGDQLSSRVGLFLLQSKERVL